MKFMIISQQNRIRTIAIAKGHATALAWGGGIQNSFVQLITLDREKLQKLSAAISKVVKKAKGTLHAATMHFIWSVKRVGNSEIDIY